MKSCLKCREINRGKWKISGPARWPGGGQEVAMGVRMDNSSVWNKLSERNTVSAWWLCRQKAWSINTPAPSKSPFSLSLLGTGPRGSALGGSPRLYLKGDFSLFDNSQHFWKELQNTATCSDFLLCYLLLLILHRAVQRSSSKLNDPPSLDFSGSHLMEWCWLRGPCSSP